MAPDRIDAHTRESVIRSWLRGAPDVVAIALAPSSARVPMPSADCFRDVATLPGAEATFVDTVVPADRMTVVTSWERAQRTGMAEGTVRVLNDSARSLRL